MSSFGHKMRELFEDVPQAIDFFADGNHAQKHAVDYFCHWLIWQSLNEQMPEIFDESSTRRTWCARAKNRGWPRNMANSPRIGGRTSPPESASVSAS